MAVRGDVAKAWSSGRETTVLQGELVDFNRVYYGGAVEARFPLSAVTPYLLAGGGMVSVDRTAPSRNYAFSELAGRLGAGLAYRFAGTSFEAFVEGSKWFYEREFYERECQERAPPRLDAKPYWAWHSAPWLE